jgi:oxygen-independent coproporphyrinogen-3 oxidase
LDEIAANWHIDANAEITLEANPSSVEAGRFRDYRSAGVNRVSLGVQALNDADLKALGRLHSVAEARAAVDVARAVFDRFTFDLIYARPRQAANGKPSRARRSTWPRSYLSTSSPSSPRCRSRRCIRQAQPA